MLNNFTNQNSSSNNCSDHLSVLNNIINDNKPTINNNSNLNNRDILNNIRHNLQNIKSEDDLFEIDIQDESIAPQFIENIDNLFMYENICCAVPGCDELAEVGCICNTEAHGLCYNHRTDDHLCPIYSKINKTRNC